MFEIKPVGSTVSQHARSTYYYNLVKNVDKYCPFMSADHKLRYFSLDFNTFINVKPNNNNHFTFFSQFACRGICTSWWQCTVLYY